MGTNNASPTPRPAPSDDGLSPQSAGERFWNSAGTVITVTVLFVMAFFLLLYGFLSVSIYFCP